MANADTLKGLLDAIGDAIRAKTGGSAKLTLAEMPDEIAGISGKALFSDLAPAAKWNRRFRQFESNADMYEVLDTFDFTDAKELQQFLYYQPNITSFDFSVLASAKPRSMSGFFQSYSTSNPNALVSFSNADALDTSLSTSFESLFLLCTSLVEADLSAWDFTAAQNIASASNAMFQSCTSLEKIVLPSTFVFSGAGANRAKFPVAMQDENGKQFASGAYIPDGAHTYTATA